MDALVKDLLQLGFSFFVAGYLLVVTTKALERLGSSLEELSVLTRRQEEDRASMGRIFERMLIILDRLARVEESREARLRKVNRSEEG